MIYVSHFSFVVIILMVFSFLLPLDLLAIAAVVLVNRYTLNREEIVLRNINNKRFHRWRSIYYSLVLGLNIAGIAFLILLHGWSILILPVSALFIYFYLSYRGIDTGINVFIALELLVFMLSQGAGVLLFVLSVSIILVFAASYAGGILERLSPAAITMGFTGFVVMFFIGSFYYGTAGTAPMKVREQPGVEYLFAGGDSGSRAANLFTRREHRFIYPDCTGDYLLLGSRVWFSKKEAAALIRTQTRNGKTEVEKLLIDSVGNNLYLDCPANEAVVPGKNNVLYRIGVDPFRVLQEKEIENGDDVLEVYRARNGDYYLLDEATYLHRFERGTLSETAVKIAGRFSAANFRLDPHGDRIIVGGLKDFRSYGMPGMELEKSVAAGVRPIEITIDTRRRLIYGTKQTSRKIFVVDLDTLESRGWIDTGMRIGNRYLDYDPYRDKLYVMNYLNGYLLIIDAQSRRVEKKIYLGRKNRSVRVSRTDRMLYVTTGHGAFRIDPDAALAGEKQIRR